MQIKTPYNSTYPQVAFHWFNQALCSFQSFCLVDSEVLQNRHLRVAAKRYSPVLLLKNIPCSLQVLQNRSLAI